MIDWSSLVLAPAMNTFAKPTVVYPLASQPGHAAYPARGIWDVQNIDVPVEGEGVYSGQIRTLGVRLAEFGIAPVPGDQVSVDDVLYVIDDTDDDGYGGSKWTLKQATP